MMIHRLSITSLLSFACFVERGGVVVWGAGMEGMAASLRGAATPEDGQYNSSFRPPVEETLDRGYAMAEKSTTPRELNGGTCGNGNRGDGVCANGQCCSSYGWCGTTSDHCSVGSPGGTCGDGNRGDGVCANGQCCSSYGWCGTTSDHCSVGSPDGTCGNGNRGNGVCANGQCCSSLGWCGTTSAHCSVGSPDGTCGNGNRGNGICADGSCCSQYGWCGSTSAHCGAPIAPSPPSGSRTISSPALALSKADIQSAMDRYNSLQGASIQVSDIIVTEINRNTAGMSLYRQLAFIAHTIWESGGYRFTEEQDIAARGDYQDCDWIADGIQYPANGKQFYGRGYIQLSWCANYKNYGSARMIDGDAEYFYKNPEQVATNYKWDSAVWFFAAVATDTSGQFGQTTRAINSRECGTAIASNRYEIFDAIARRVGMTGYSSAGC